MIETRALRFRALVVFTLLIAIFLTGYSAWTIVDLNAEHARDQSLFLNQYTARAISRVKANPDWFSEKRTDLPFKRLGNQRVGLVQSYSELQRSFPNIPTINNFESNKIFIRIKKFHGPFNIPDYLMIKPVFASQNDSYFGFLIFNSKTDDQGMGQEILERIQPAIALTLISILILVIIELFHINRVNQTIQSFASWAEKLEAGSAIPKPPNFESSKYNYIAYAIDKSLTGITDVLEKEQSFAKFTSHELRTPIAALSANMEVLELMMKDLSPQERSVLKTMETSVSDMKYQTDALLWLSSESNDDVEYSPCHVETLVEKALKDNEYLGKEKNIQTSIEGNACLHVDSHPVLLQIILNNLIRNAYQNTCDGEITIELLDKGISICNRNTGGDTAGPNEVGFGIGLVLVKKLVEKINIRYEAERISEGWRVILNF